MGSSAKQEADRTEIRKSKTQKQILNADTFAMALRVGRTLSQAFRETFPDKGENWADASIHSAASLYAKSDEVTLRIEELRGKSLQNHLVTVDSLTEELEEARFIAALTNNPSAMTQATLGKAKIHGIGTEKVELNLGEELRKLVMSDIPDTTGLPDLEAIEGEFDIE